MPLKSVIPFRSKSKTSKKDSGILEEGDFGSLKYTVYKRGVIHITDGKLTFKKDPYVFEKEINNIDFATKNFDSQKIEIKGSGDNADLILIPCDGDFKASLEEKEFRMIAKLKNIIRKSINARTDKPKGASSDR